MPDHRDPGPRRRSIPLAAPAAAGIAAAVASILATSLDIWDLPTQVKVGITVCTALLVGLLTWATTGAREREQQEPAPGHGPSWRPPDQWPPVSTHFTGRTESLAELRQVFAERRRSRGPGENTSPLVVSVYGRGGVGKSALTARFGHEVADRFPDGRLYADLRGAVEAPVQPEEVLIGFLRALGVRLTTDPGGLTELRKLWLTWTKGRRILIGLDNAQDGDQVKDLIPAEPGCAVMITSRQPLFLLNTYDKQLSVFSEAQGVELLARLAGDDRVAADLESAQEIVRMCDHLPLAIGICGGRLATRENWTLRGLADRLRDERRRLDQLELARRLDKSVRASLQLSYDDCTGLQRRLLRLLSLLTAPDVPGWVAGELLAASELEGADQLEALVDTQLAECSGIDFSGVMRYRLHDLVRIFARELAYSGSGDDDGHRRAAIERVLSGYRRRAETAAMARWPQDWGRSGRNADPASTTLAQASAADWLNAERLTLVAMINQARGLEMWELAWGLGRAFCSLCHSLRAYWSDWRAVAEIVCEAAVHMDDRRALGIALLDRAAVTGGQGSHQVARADAERALELFTGLGESWWAARAMRSVGMSLFSDGNLDLGQDYLIEAITAFKGEDDRWWTARTQRNLAELRLAQRRPEQAKELLEEALQVFKHDRNRYSEAQTLRAYGEVLGATARALHAKGETRAAEEDFIRAGFSLDRAAETFRLRGELWEEARCLRAAGEVGNPADGLRELTYVRRATEMLSALGDSWGVARAELSAGRAHGRLGRAPEARASLERAVHAFEELGDRWWMARSLRYLGEAHLEAGDRDAALFPLRHAQDIYRSLGNQAGMGRTLELLRRAGE
ncbi:MULTISPECIES: tetratricopeptide repeat protein [Streptosporangium]|uniref:Tetratricopeptide (TPR) repeat protein n=1 Tax=Streptosporangium brasiliense TaxID=47480 RepID=A0ABT9RB70_9ACTN|nr:tetratricopeptide repeat protein [Streptosporangium brasiliense]MDP9866501.1 tetratricopeptide (TPR) repeat protein [Streptosporangium brasiliense]